MKRFAIIVAFLQCLFSASAQNHSFNIIPQPVSLKAGSGFFTLKNTSVIELNESDEDVKRVAGFLSKKITAATGFTMPVKTTASFSDNASFQMGIVRDPSIKKEGYKIEVSPKRVSIMANDAAGLFYGVQTLLQLMPKEINSKNKITNQDWKI